MGGNLGHQGADAQETPMKRRSFLTGALATAGMAARADAPAVSVRPRAKPGTFQGVTGAGQIASAGLGGRVGYVLADAETGAVIETHNPLLPQPPASVAKAVTALYALETLGAGHRFETRLIATGPVRGGRVEGDLALVGGGDPTLDTDGLHDLAVGVRDAGITEIAGDLLVHHGALPVFDRIDDSQPDHVGYNPAVGGLNLNFNRVHFEWRRAGAGYETTMDARTGRFRPDVTTSAMRVADRSMPVYTYARDGARDAWTVARGQLGQRGARWLPVRNPALYAGDVMRTMLRANGIVTGAARPLEVAPTGAVIARAAGVPLDRVARGMLRHSTNLTAEVLGLSASVARGVAPQSLAASGDAMAGWLAERAGTRRVEFDDHSGLNGTSRITASDMVRILTASGAEAQLRPILREIVVGERARVPVRAKTGTLNFVSGLAGYLDAGGRSLAFAIFAADVAQRERLTLAQRERPEGGRAWARRARRLQFDLVERWAAVHA
jgi:D-alanyl-D-alanine carboxypeptidase/D-alanyl-D-alanine-endopeptidase (penicillin-binding protein 4)